MLALHSPFHFLRELPVAAQQEQFGTGAALRFADVEQAEVLPMSDCLGQWLLQGLPWDSSYFDTPTYRLFTGLFTAEATPTQLQDAALALRQQLAARGPYYAFSVVPAEDVQLLQALTGGGWKLIETRFNFYCPTAAATLPAPASVRLAKPEEAEYIGQISATARNPYDRFHADPWFGEARADAFLARYAEATVSGSYSDAVLVPDEVGLPLDSFLAIGDTKGVLGLPGSGISRVLLTAVGPLNRGWHIKLVAETVRRAQLMKMPYVLMTTQATNRAVFRTCEKLGFRLGNTTHVLACSGE
jgi:dTDP-4-amino-4,6-dideoxy-D-galactose acyltransferase